MGKGSNFGGPSVAAGNNDHIAPLGELEEALDDTEFQHLVPHLAPVVRRRVGALQNLQKQYMSLQKQYHADVRDLERKYQKLYDPLFDKRASIATGEYEPTDGEAKVEVKPGDENAKFKEATAQDAEIKGIPEFWLQVLQSNSCTAETITEEDEAALKYLRDIRCSELEGESEGFILTFHFAENPFFTNTVLSKTYNMEQDELFGELEYENAEGTKIEWKAGKNLTVKQIKKKTKAKGKKPARMVTVEEPCPSFFSFFSPMKTPEADDDDDGGEALAMMEMDFDIGFTIKDKLIPFSVLWFTGEAAEYEDGEDDFGEDDEDGEDDDDEEDEDDDEEEGQQAPPKRGGGARGGRGGAPHHFNPPSAAKPSAGAPGQPQQPECKQQ